MDTAEYFSLVFYMYNGFQNLWTNNKDKRTTAEVSFREKFSNLQRTKRN